MNSTNEARGRPPWLERANLVRGLRAALALSVPLFVGQFTHRTELSLWGELGALFLILSDGGGPYRRRARELMVGAVLMVVALFLGALCGGSVPLAVLALAAGAFAAGLGPAFGRNGAALGRLAATPMVVSLAHPAGLPDALQRAAEGGIGAAWALVLALILWPFRPHQALFDLVAASWKALADLLIAIRAEPEEAEGPTSPGVTGKTAALRDTLEEARHALVLERAGSEGSGPITDTLLVLHRLSSQMGAALTALEEAHVPEAGSTGAIPSALDALEAGIRAVHGVVVSRQSERMAALGSAVDALRAALPAAQGAGSGADTGSPATPLRTSLGYLEAARDALCNLFEVGSDRPRERVMAPVTAPGEGLPNRAELFHWDSIVFRHALRLAAASALGIFLFVQWHLPRGYWIALTVVIVLQPDYGGTLERVRDRVLGTAFGAALGTLFLLHISHPLLRELLLPVSTFLYVILLRNHYRLAVLFLTCQLVLLLENFLPVGWELVAYRVVYTAVGGAISWAAFRSLWPRWAPAELPQRLAEALRADADYLRTVAQALRTGLVYREWVLARRKAELASANAAAALQRGLRDPEPHRGSIREQYPLVASTARMGRALTALLTHLPAASEHSDELSLAAEELAVFTEGLAEAIETGTPPDPALLSALRERLERRVDASQYRNRDSPAARVAATYLAKIARELEAFQGELSRVAPDR